MFYMPNLELKPDYTCPQAQIMRESQAAILQ